MIGTDVDGAATGAQATPAQRAERPVWRDAWAIFALALLLRVAAVFILWYAAPRPIETLLGSDSRNYLDRARELAASDFHLAGHPAKVLGTYHAAPYYLFGGAIWLGADLVQLQLLNSVLGALAASLAFAAARAAGLRYALTIGVLVAVNPSTVLLSSFDLLKDPSVMLATIAAIYGIILGLSTTRPARGIQRLLPWGLVTIALIYLRMSRFYVATFMEVALIAAVFVMILRTKSEDRRAVGLCAAFTVVLGEAIPALLGWPSSLSLFLARVAPVAAWHETRFGAADGLASELIAAFESSSTERAETFKLVDVLRRVFGPFVWVAPPRWDRMTVVFTGDYLLYPGTVLWYAMLPYLIAGVWASRRLLSSGARKQLWFLMLSVFVSAYLLEFVLVSLSYRQREAMLPVFLLLAFAGYDESKRWTTWKYWYAVYWLGIALMAIVHLSVGAALRG
jgi:hypothetical protein